MAPTTLLGRLFAGEDVPELMEETKIGWRARVNIPQAQMLASCPYVENIRELYLDRGGLSIKALELIANSKRLANLEHFSAGKNRIRPNGAVAIAEATYFKKLRVLSLHKSSIEAKGCRALAESSELPKLEVLNLNDTKIGADGGEALACWQHSPLKELHLQHSQLGDRGLKALAQAKGLSNLKVLDLQKSRIRGAGLEALAESPYLSNLEELNLRGNKIERRGLEALAASTCLPKLRKLNLRRAYLEGDDVGVLAGSPLVAQLDELNLRVNKMSFMAYAKMVMDPHLSILDSACWPELCSGEEEILELLDLEGDEELFNVLCIEGFNALNADIKWRNLDIRKAVRSPWATVADDIKWRGCALSKTAARAIAGAKRLRGLRRLDLEDNELGVDAMEALAGSENLRDVVALNLSKNPIGDEGFRQLVGSPLLRNLEEFEASETGLSEEGFEAILNEPSSFGNLRVLKLADNELKPSSCQRIIDASGSSAMHRFVEAGDGWHSLEVLDLSGNYLTNDGVAALFDSWLLHPIRRLSLRRTSIGDRAIRCLLHSVVLMPNLTHLELSENNISDDGARMLSGCPKLAGLEKLGVYQNRISHDGFFGLARSSVLRSAKIVYKYPFELM